ncbi:MAG: hypothetical protein M1546_19870, partial [Chloroflexi bacterium]|nr:hypothetical protein [Chloroflexota bacterium]
MKTHRSLIVRTVRTAIVIGLSLQMVFTNTARPASAIPASSTVSTPTQPLMLHAPEGPGKSDPIPQADTPVAPALVNARHGGRVRGSRHAEVAFTPGALRSDMVVSITESYRLDAVTLDRESVTTPESLFITVLPHMPSFDAPVTLTVDLSGFLTAEMWASGRRPVLHYLRPVETDKAELSEPDVAAERKPLTYVREELAATFDPYTWRLIAPLSHFSTLELSTAAEVGAPQPWEFTSNLGEINLFRGAATYAMPIQVPALADGTQPHLNLSYSSAATEASAEDQHGLTYGWSLDVPHISRAIRVRREDDGSEAKYRIMVDSEPDAYKLNLDGAAYYLRNISGSDDEYVTEPYAPIRVVRCETGSTHPDCNIPYTMWYDAVQGNGDGADTCTRSEWYYFNPGYWQVWTANGTRYVFGLDQASTVYYASFLDPALALDGRKLEYQAWYLSRVYSPLRDNPTLNQWTAQYVYTQTYSIDTTSANGKHEGQDCPAYGEVHERQPQIWSINYGNSQGLGGSSHYTVTFGYWYGSYMVWRLDRIRAYASSTLLKEYEIGYCNDFQDPGEYACIGSIQEKAWNGSSLDHLPATTFEYTRTTDHLLTAINNGYGGRVEYTYGWADGGDKIYYRVGKRTTTDGAGGTTEDTYEYSSPCFNYTSTSCYLGHDAIWQNGDSNPQQGALVGHEYVVQTTAPPGGSALAKTSHHMYADRKKLGYEYETRHLDGAGIALSAQTINYALREGTAFSLPQDAWFIAPTTVTDFISGDIGTSPYIQVGYEYGNTTNGLPTAVYEYGLDGSGDERSTHRTYAVNTPLWIVDKL